MGQSIKGYELRERIGAGGFGAVYKAYQSTVGREVAIKIILPGFTNHPDFIRRFETEAQLVARLEHLHIAPLYDYWRDPGGAYLVMRYMRGGSLRRALMQEPYSLEEASLLIDQITSALSVVHTHGVVHRDIKPENILLDEDGNAYLADFGIAKEFGIRTNTVTAKDALVGSPDYLAPEQARSEDVTPKTDIYSLGVVLYEMLAGEHPFPNLSPVERLFKHINDPVPEITTIDRDASKAINAVVQKATAKKPKDRYDDARTMAIAFREAAGLSVSQSARSLVELLTPREQEVLKLVMDGKSNREIAQELTIELGTVKWYVTRIYKKLNVRSRVQAIVRARELNLIVDGKVATTATTGMITGFPKPENPYKGLKAFQIADERQFYGREKLTRKVIERLAEGGDHARFLAIVGPSGSGKSSLVRAGLIPAVWRGELPGSEKWFIADMIPGSHPLDGLEVALLKVASEQPADFAEQLQRDERGLHRAAQLILPDDDSELLLVIDQFEELFTLVESEEMRAHLLDLIVNAIEDKRSQVRVVVTLRADFYDRPLQYPEFGELVQHRVETVLPLSAEELERAIARPAEGVGVKFEEGLVASIVEDVHYQPGGLPLMQYALTELFDARSDHTLTLEAYQGIGGSTGALAKRADELHQELDDEGQAAIKQIFLRLVTLGEAGEDTRRRVHRSELLAVGDDPDRIDELIDLYTASRLLATDIDYATRSPTVELAHEAILNEWPRLRVWLEDSREDIRLQRALAVAAAEWRKADQDSSFLLRGTRLGQFENWSERSSLALTAKEKEFLTASVEAGRIEEREKEAQIQRELEAAQTIRRRAVYLTGALIVAVGLAIAAITFARRATSSAELAEQNLQTAQAESSIRATAEAVALDERAEAERQAGIAIENADLARSRELSAFAISALDDDPSLSKLLALAAADMADPPLESVSVLHRAIQTDRVIARYSWPQDVARPNQLWTHLHPSGDRLVASGQFGLPSPHLEVVDLSTGNVLWAWDVDHPELAIERPRFSQNGELVIASTLWESGTRAGAPPRSDDLGVFVWDAETGERLKHIELGSCGGTIQAISGSRLLVRTIPDDDLGCFWPIPVAVGDLRLELIDLETGARELLTANSRRGRQGIEVDGGAAFSGDGRYVAFDDIGQGSVIALDLATGEQVAELDLANPDRFDSFVRALNVDGSLLLYGTDPIQVVDVSTGEVIAELQSPVQERSVQAVDGIALLTAFDGGLYGFELATGSELFALPGVGDGNVSATGEGLALVSESTSGAVLIDTRPRGELGAIRTCPAFTWSGSLTATSDLATFLQFCDGFDEDSTTQVVDLLTGKIAYTLPGGSGQEQPISPDGTRFVRQEADGLLLGPLVVRDVRRGEELLELEGLCWWDQGLGAEAGECKVGDAPPFAMNAYRVRWSPDGSMIAVMSLIVEGTGFYIAVWDADSGELLFWETGDTELSYHSDVVFTPDSSKLVASYAVPALRVFSTVTWEIEMEAPLDPDLAEQGFPLFADYTQDGSTLIAAANPTLGESRSLHWLDAETLQTRFRKANPHEATMTTMAMNADRSLLATGSANGVIRIWTAATGALLHEVPVGDTWVSGVAFIDDRHLAVTPRSGNLYIVTIDTEELLEIARVSLTRGFTPLECEKFNFGDDCPTLEEMKTGR